MKHIVYPRDQQVNGYRNHNEVGNHPQTTYGLEYLLLILNINKISSK